MNTLKNKTCSKCEKGKMKRTIVNYRIQNIDLGRFPAFVCDHCSEEWFDEETSKKIESLEKKNNLWNTDGFGILKGKRLKPFVRDHGCLDREL